MGAEDDSVVRYCWRCGQDLSSEARYCDKCGADQNERGGDTTATTDATRTKDTQTDDSGGDEARSITLSKIIAYLAGIVFILVGLAGAAQTPAALLITVGGVFALPPVRRRVLGEQFDVSLSKYAVALIVIILVIAGSAAIQSTEEVPVHEPGDTFEVGDDDEAIAYTVENVETGGAIDQGLFEAEADGMYVVVELQIENRADESITLSRSQFTVVDSGDTSYDADSDASIAIDDAVIFEQTNPGVTQRGVVVFDVPEGTSDLSLEIEPAGIFSTSTEHRVDLSGEI